MEHCFTVTEYKIRLDRFLANKLPGFSRARIQRDIEMGQVRVNGEPVLESSHIVRVQNDIVYTEAGHYGDTLLQATNTPLKVLYDNHGLLVIDKPAGLAVHPGAGFKGETLASALLYSFKDIAVVGEQHRPGIVHRLDKDTSGIILVAKTQDMYEYLKDAFAERKIKKEYIALVAGRVEKPQGVVDMPMGKSKKDFRKQTVIDPENPKQAVTEYRVLEYLEAEKTSPDHSRHGQAQVDTYTLLLVKLHTGRTHQIRVHMAGIGHPLMGDELYGGQKTRLSGLRRQFLHAKKIEVRLPDGTWMEAEAEFPDDLKKVLSGLRSHKVNQL